MPDRLVVAVSGSRSWPDGRIVWAVLTGLAPDVLIVGDCPTGADAFARSWATGTTAGLRAILDVYDADWDTHGRAAGPVRNQQVVKALAGSDGDTLLVAFADDLARSRGTADCVRQARRLGLPVYLVSRR